MQSTDTPCKNCIFAEYDNLTQTGCSIGKIDSFKKAGIEVVEAYDEEKEFFVIKGHKCMFGRTKAWGDENEKDTWAEKIEKEIEMPYQAIVIATNDSKKLTKTINSLLAQKIKPRHITIIRPVAKIKKNKIEDIRPLLNKSGIQWRVETIIDSSFNYKQMVDLVVPFVIFPYYAVFKSGIEVPLDTFKVISDKINNEAFVFGALSPNSKGQGLVIPYTIHKILAGNSNKPLLNKIREDNTCQIIPITQICPSFPS